MKTYSQMLEAGEVNTHDANGNEFWDVKERRLLDESIKALGRFGSGSGTITAEEAARLHSTLLQMQENADLMVIAKGYHWLVGNDGKILALTAGDHHYEDSGITADLEFTNPQSTTQG